MTCILITGADGLLGYDLMKTLSQGKDHHVIATNRQRFDITDLEATTSFLEEARPEVIVHAAAFTDVDACEIEKERAFQTNASGARNVALAARRVGAKLVYISTDYVFDGVKEAPYQEEDRPNPINIYGASKWEGERLVQEECPESFIVRTAWLYGIRGKSFVKTMLRLAQTEKEISVVHDQRGTPTWSHDLARQLQALIATDRYGIYHATSQGSCSWYEFALAIFRASGLPVQVQPVPSERFPRAARRPRNSVLENRRLGELGLHLMSPWEQSLAQFLKVLNQEASPL